MVEARIRSSEPDLEISESVIIGYNPRQIVSPLTGEKDFDSFWERTLEQLANIEPEYEVVRVPERDSETHTADHNVSVLI